ncbi:TniQ family protein [Elizabethkingia anophelis]|nr:TniQ family protein [Elizabethkingia anophelis]
MVFIRTCGKEIFPVYIPPYADELFSSWYCRLAIKHRVKPLTLVKNNFDYNAPVFNRDIDNLSPQYLLDFLYLHTPLNKERIKKLFLSSYSGSYCSDDSENRNNILALGINHRDRKRFGMMCCPKCLRRESYYKKEWRLFTSILCSKCNSYLIDRCPECHKPISYHRIYNSGNQSVLDYELPFTLCWYCKTDLAEVDVEKPGDLELRYQRFINKTLLKGCNEYSNYSFSFIRGLIILCRAGRSRKFKQRFSRLLNSVYNVELTPVEKKINLWNLEERIATLPYIFRFVEDAKDLRDEISYFNISRSYLGQDTVIDYWLHDLLDL